MLQNNDHVNNDIQLSMTRPSMKTLSQNLARKRLIKFGNVKESTLARNRENGRITKKELKEWAESFMAKFDQEINVLQTEIEQMKLSILESKELDPSNFISYNKFMNLHPKYKFPLGAYNDFKEFNQDLKLDNNKLKTNLKKHLKISINIRLEVVKNVQIILNKFLSVPVMKLYTVQVQKPNKKIFKQTEFCKCLSDSIRATYRKKKEVTEKDVWKCVGNIFNYVQDSRRRLNFE